MQGLQTVPVFRRKASAVHCPARSRCAESTGIGVHQMAISVFNRSIGNKSGRFMLTWNALVGFFFIEHKSIGVGNCVSPKKGRIILNPGRFYGNEYASIPHFSIAKPESRHLQLFLPNHFHLGIELAVCIQELPLRQLGGQKVGK